MISIEIFGKYLANIIFSAGRKSKKNIINDHTEQFLILYFELNRLKKIKNGLDPISQFYIINFCT